MCGIINGSENFSQVFTETRDIQDADEKRRVGKGDRSVHEGNNPVK